MPIKHCPSCGRNSSTLHLEKDNFQILRCNSCSLVYLNHEPNNEWLANFYSSEYFEADSDDHGYESYQDCEKFLTLNFKRRIRQLIRYAPAGNVLDIGCGYGFFLNCLGDGHTGFGLDISEHAVRIARKQFGLNARAGPLEKNTFPPSFFSLITMWDVIEHLPDPKATFEILHTILKDDGVITLTTGNVDSLIAKISAKRWHLYSLPEHLWFFSPQTLTNLLDQTGFRVLELRNEWNYYSLDYIVERMLKTMFKTHSASHHIPFKLMLQRLVIPLSLYDITYLVCQKK